MENEHDVKEAVVVENEKIIFVGSNEDAMKLRKNHEVIDLNGKTMTPGFFDPHSHFVASSFMVDMIDLSAPPVGTVESIEDVKKIMREAIKKRNLKPGKVIVGSSYDDALFAEGRTMTKDDLDEISTEHGIIVGHQSGHVGVCNSFILDKYKITSESENPEGGVYGRYPGTKKPNGQLEEKAYMNISQKSIDLNPFKLKEKVQKAQLNYVKNGITTAQEGGSIPATLFLARLANKFNWFDIDVVAYVQVPKLENFDKVEKLSKYFNYRNKLRIGGVKFFLDGSPQAKTAWLSEPYHVAPVGQDSDYSGYPIYEDNEFVKDIYKEALKRNWQILTHCNGDMASEQLLNAYEAARSELEHTKELRPVMIHSQMVREDQLDRMNDIGMIPSFFNDHTFFWGDWHYESVLGPNRANRISPMTSAKKRNMPYTIHTDTPVIPPNLIYSMWCAVNRKTRNGRVLGEEFRVSPYEALKAITINSAIQHFEESDKGSITVGKKADLVILDKNPLTINPDDIKNIQVLETIKNGTSIYKLD
jgi:predicted amidohydrolase YtcJ